MIQGPSSGAIVSQTSGIVRPAASTRRSTRVEEAIPITVVGVDSARGPYREQVCTSALSFHGCKYESKFDVLNNSIVILELGGENADSPPVTARGRVKWAKRPGFAGGTYQTAIELEEPGNIWGLNAPPIDWLELAASPKTNGDAGKPQPFLVSRPDMIAAAAAEPAHVSASAGVMTETGTRQSVTVAPRPMGDLMRNFQSEMEGILSEAAAAAVRERAAASLDEARAAIKEEARRALAEAAASQATPLIEHSLRQFKQASHETALAFQVQWTLQLEDDVKKALGRIEARHNELGALSESMAASAIEKLQRAIEASRRDGIDRIIAGLKEQFTPLVEQAKSVAAELNACKVEAATILDASLEKFSARAEEICTRVESKLEETLQKRLEKAQQEIDRSGMIATNLALDSLHQASEQHEGEVRARLENDVAPASALALAALRESAEEARRKFIDELNERTRRHFEKIGSAITGLGRESEKV